LAILLGLFILGSGPGAAKEKPPAKPVVLTPYLFLDETAEVVLPAGKNLPGEIACHLSTITTAGWGRKKTQALTVAGGRVQVTPLVEGIHIVHLGAPINQEVRFLAMAPPPPLDPAQVKQQLPRQGEKLFSGKPFTILSMGDSVTKTGDYESMLVRMLRRATGNKKISHVDRSYPGCSVDATVRHFHRDTHGIKPDLGLLMYGLNDQICFVPLRAFLEQYAWVARSLRDGFQADMMFLEPTPHIAIHRSGRGGEVAPPHFALRTIGFAQAVRTLGQDLSLPVVPTFSAVWGEGGDSLSESGMRLWPLYPLSYRKPFSSLLESTGKGDTIHPNALGHLQMAKAVYAVIAGKKRTAALLMTGVSEWTDAGVVSRVRVSNRSGKRRTGRLEVYPPTKAQFTEQPVLAYDLLPEASIEFKVTWASAAKPEDLFTFPNDVYLSQESIPVTVVDFSGKGSRPRSVHCPFRVGGDFRTERLTVMGRTVRVVLRTPQGERAQTVDLPEGRQVGRIRLLKELIEKGERGVAAGELVYTAYGQAVPGEAVVDGLLGEWQGQRGFPVGRSCQARGTTGPFDTRKGSEVATTEWTARAGEKGVYLAVRGEGRLQKDRVCLFFDPRPASELGTAGPYYWVGISFLDKGRVRLQQGATSPNGKELKGRWVKTGTGLTAELFIPYTVMDRRAWPASGDLGFSVVWRHASGDGQTTRLTWFEDGHEWNPRWYGVLRRQKGTEPLPILVRIK
jgi:lysophospholipase L1-like esterase